MLMFVSQCVLKYDHHCPCEFWFDCELVIHLKYRQGSANVWVLGIIRCRTLLHGVSTNIA